MSVSIFPQLAVRAYTHWDLARQLPRWERFLTQSRQGSPDRLPGWLLVLPQALKHEPYCLEASVGDEIRGLLPLAYVRSLLFGRFLVSLPYLNCGGVVSDDAEVAGALIDRAIPLADELDVGYLELRHEQALPHSALSEHVTNKVHMRLPLPATPDELWDDLSPKVRNQVRKGEKCGLTVHWGKTELLREFYEVFSTNMRDLGTPVYSLALFRAALQHLPDRSELCVIRTESQPVAAALLVHGFGITGVPSASSLRRYNHTCANMLLYWHLLQRAIERGQAVFDFGRSSRDSSTYRFKEQWGAQPHPAQWQHYLRHGAPADMRPDHPRYQRRIRLWRRLPLPLPRLLGPPIVRGIP